MRNKHKSHAEKVAQQVDALLAGQTSPADDPLLTTAQLLADSAPATPSPVFAQRLRQQLLQAGAAPTRLSQERRRLMWLRFAAVAMTVSLIIALIGTALPRNLSAAQVLARAAQSTAVEPGQIIYQVYSRQGSLYREWQRVENGPAGSLLPIETLTIRYAKDDLAFTTPLEWVYHSPTRLCRLPVSNDITDVDAEGCQTFVPATEPAATAPSGYSESASSDAGYTEAFDPAIQQQIAEALRETPDTFDVQALETIQTQIARLQTSAENVRVSQTQLEQRQVYALISSRSRPAQPDAGAFTHTLYIDPQTFVPVGYSYSVKATGNEVSSWSAIIFEYRVLDAAALDFNPFAWPPATRP